jgi:hypothetical protein
MFAAFTILSYLIIGTISYKILITEEIKANIPISFLNIFTQGAFHKNSEIQLNSPKQTFTEIKIVSIPKKQDSAKVKKFKKIYLKDSNKNIVDEKQKMVKPFLLPFNQEIEINPINVVSEIPQSFSALYVSSIKVDDKKMDQQLAEQFYNYQVESPIKKQINKAEKREIKEVDSAEIVEEVEISDLVAFNYSTAKKEIVEGKIQGIGKVQHNIKVQQNWSQLPTSLGNISKNKKEITQLTHNQKNLKTEKNIIQEKAKETLKKINIEDEENFENRIKIYVLGTDLVNSQKKSGFEIRPQDDLKESYSDFNRGEVIIDQLIDNEKMNRTVTILKHGYSPTNLDLILEEGVSEITVPLITEQKIQELLSTKGKYENLGVVLIELDEKTDSASLDVSSLNKIKLNENLQPVQGDDYSYIMFVGVRPGNALLSYQTVSGDIVSKIIHIHENELTFDSNFYEEIKDESLVFLEDDLLGKDQSPLIISASQVKHFATNKTLSKKSNNAFTTKIDKTILGGRKYLELNHLSEPVFVGYREQTKLEVPSENFMRYVLSSSDSGTLSNRCLVQMNLNKKINSIDIGRESQDSSSEIKVQYIDKNGKFYNSASSQTHKIIISGEMMDNHGDQTDSKINIKINYQDNSTQFMSSYCSPNTYLVEQL